ncbi:MAG: putative baseplate assembly protein [Actinomycetales bacterium]
MTLPAPHLDDRSFQDLVDEAKRLVQQRCPEWTDHNVADPGVTLIETFAFMVDQLIYRLNRVPDLNYIKFLELLGESLRPPAAAIAPQRFLLSVPQATDVLIPQGTQVSTARRSTETPLTYTTTMDLTLVSVALLGVATQKVGQEVTRADEVLATGNEFPCFSAIPHVGDALYVGLTNPAPACIVRLTVDSQIEGIGVDPLRPPLVIEAWDGHQWYPVTLLQDNTGGLNRRGTIEFHIPRQVASVIDGRTGGWLRFRIVPTSGDQPAYTASPQIRSIDAATIGGVVDVSHSMPVLNEVLGLTTGAAGQVMQLNKSPLIAGQEELTIEVSSPNGWNTWTRVDSFAQSSADDRHFMVDDVAGQIRFGPLIRMPDGSARSYGATPQAACTVRIPSYRVGGGRQGNVDAGTITVLRSSIPFISKVDNMQAAVGGVDAETLDQLKARAAISVRARNRAVTPTDIEQIVQTAAPTLVRVHCVDAVTLDRPGTILILVIPEVPEGHIPFELLQPRAEVLNDVQSYLDERRLLGTTMRVEPPRYLGVSVMVRIAVVEGAARDKVAAAANDAITRFVHPTLGGYDGKGWPFGRALAIGDIYGLLQRVPGILYVDRARVVAVDAITGERGEPGDQVQPGQLDLLYNTGNDIEVLP